MDNEVSIIRRITWIGFYVNAVLMAIKIVTGLYGHSEALVADGVHSMSDFATDLIVLCFVAIAYKSADSAHPYGHGKFETLASLIIGVSLIAVAAGIGLKGIDSIIDAMAGNILPRPDLSVVIVAVVSIAAKEILYRITANIGRRIGSSLLLANAWHHRTDAYSSVATVIGASAAFFLGQQWRVLDPIASVFISVFIGVSAFKIIYPALNELLEKSLPETQVIKINETMSGVPGVISHHRLRTRRNGRSAIIDVHIKVNPDITVTEGHNIASEVENRLNQLLGMGVIVYVHVEPFVSGRNSDGLML